MSLCFNMFLQLCQKRICFQTVLPALNWTVRENRWKQKRASQFEWVISEKSTTQTAHAHRQDQAWTQWMT